MLIVPRACRSVAWVSPHPWVPRWQEVSVIRRVYLIGTAHCGTRMKLRVKLIFCEVLFGGIELPRIASLTPAPVCGMATASLHPGRHGTSLRSTVCVRLLPLRRRRESVGVRPASGTALAEPSGARCGGWEGGRERESIGQTARTHLGAHIDARSIPDLNLW